jgi:hypothetical protein
MSEDPGSQPTLNEIGRDESPDIGDSASLEQIADDSKKNTAHHAQAPNQRPPTTCRVMAGQKKLMLKPTGMLVHPRVPTTIPRSPKTMKANRCCKPGLGLKSPSRYQTSAMRGNSFCMPSTSIRRIAVNPKFFYPSDNPITFFGYLVGLNFSSYCNLWFYCEEG